MLLALSNSRPSRAAIAFFATAAGILILAASSAYAVDRSWTGATDTTWSTGTNWSGGKAPGGPDNAKFDGSFTNQPNLTGAATVGGLWIATGVGQGVTISGGANVLTLNANTINGTSSLGILIDNSSAYTLTISCGLKVNAAQTWLNNSSNVFSVSGAVNDNGKNLTIDGSGAITI